VTDGTLIRTLSGHTSLILWSVDLLNSDILVSGSFDKKIKFWSKSSGVCLKTIDTGTKIRVLAVLKFTLTNRKYIFI
jgi:WD40 repeat protein